MGSVLGTRFPSDGIVHSVPDTPVADDSFCFSDYGTIQLGAYHAVGDIAVSLLR